MSNSNQPRDSGPISGLFLPGAARDRLRAENPAAPGRRQPGVRRGSGESLPSHDVALAEHPGAGSDRHRGGWPLSVGDGRWRAHRDAGACRRRDHYVRGHGLGWLMFSRRMNADRQWRDVSTYTSAAQYRHAGAFSSHSAALASPTAHPSHPGRADSAGAVRHIVHAADRAGHLVASARLLKIAGNPAPSRSSRHRTPDTPWLFRKSGRKPGTSLAP